MVCVEYTLERREMRWTENKTGLDFVEIEVFGIWKTV